MPNPTTKEPREASDTPRTDAAAYGKDSCSLGPLPDSYSKDGEHVSADFARKLERENVALRKVLAEHVRAYNHYERVRHTGGAKAVDLEFEATVDADLAARAALKPAGE